MTPLAGASTRSLLTPVLTGGCRSYVPQHVKMLRADIRERSLARGSFQTRRFTTETERLPFKERPRADYNDDSSRKLVVKLHTLDRTKLTPKDYVDLSDVRVIAADAKASTPPGGKTPLVPYGRRHYRSEAGRDVIEHTPFPVNTRGFFYYHRRRGIPVSGSLRFRVMQSPDSSLFDQGKDLLNEFGAPWQIPLLTIATSEAYAGLRDVLLRSPPNTGGPWSIADCLEKCTELRKNSRTVLGPLTQVIYESGEPFYLSLASKDASVFVGGIKRLLQIKADRLFWTHETAGWRYEAGALLCRFERQGGFLYVRVLRIIEPVRVKKDYPPVDSLHDEPQAGQLITRYGRPWAYFGTDRSPYTTAVREALLRRHAVNPALARSRGTGNSNTRPMSTQSSQ